MSPTSTEQALRAHLRSHNLAVLAASGVALVFSAVGWAVLYGASYWVAMIVVTLGHNGEMSVSPVFAKVFLGTAAVLLLAARVDQWFFPDARAVDERPPVEHFADILFFVPRFTMSCWQNLGALAHLTGDEMKIAGRLMDRLKTEGRVSLQELSALFADGRRMQRVIDSLLVTGLVDQRRDENRTWIHIGALAPEIFRSKSHALPAPEDPLAGVPQVKIRRRVRLLPPDGDGGEP
ncbi:MAG: hypothetical protein ABIP20_19815 [Chthoniobacteraceae bacterium]